MSKIILITGANRSIGYAILSSLAERLPDAKYVLACRDVSSGEEAITSLRASGIKAELSVVQLDQTSDASIEAAVDTVTKLFGYIDVLINNAGAFFPPAAKDSLPALRSSWASTLSTNVTSIFVLSTALLPLLHASPCGGQIINISSARGSLTRSTAGNLPPTRAVPYSVSKTALNALTIEMQKSEDARVAADVDATAGTTVKKARFYAVSPGHCKTAFNGFSGTREPRVGAEVVVRLVLDGVHGSGGELYEAGSFWETDLQAGVEGEMVRIPW